MSFTGWWKGGLCFYDLDTGYNTMDEIKVLKNNNNNNK